MAVTAKVDWVSLLSVLSCIGFQYHSSIGAANGTDPCISGDTIHITDYWRFDSGGSICRPVNNYYDCDRDRLNNGQWFRWVTTVWRSYGNGVGTVCQLYGNYMATVWERCGNCMGTIWQPRGNSVGTIWQPRGNSVGTVWELYGNCMGADTKIMFCSLLSHPGLYQKYTEIDLLRLLACICVARIQRVGLD